MVWSLQSSARARPTYFPHEAGGARDEDRLVVVELEDGGVVVPLHLPWALCN